MSSQYRVPAASDYRGKLPPPLARDGAVAFPAPARTLLDRLWVLLRSHEFQLRVAWTLVIVGTAVDALVLGQHSLLRYTSYHADAFDLGNMDQAVWNTLHGHPFRFTNRGIDWQGPPTRLGLHIEPILLLIAPLYLIHSGPETLLALQSVALALGSIPLFLLARRRLPDLPLIGAAFVAAYWCCPQLLGEALWDFHPVALATPLLIAAVYALDARRYGWFAIAAALAAMTKEDVALSVIPLGLYIWLWQGRPRIGQAVIAAAAVWTALCFFVILPHFNGGASGGNFFWQRYSWMGSSAGEATTNVLTHPWLLLGAIFLNAAKRGYLAAVLRIGGGMSLLAPWIWLAALPELAVNLLSTHPEQYSSFFQYNAMLVAYLFAGGILGVAYLYELRRRAERGIRVPADPYGDGGSSQSSPRRHRLVSDISRRWGSLVDRVAVPTAWIGPLAVAWLAVTTVWGLAAADGRLAIFWAAGAAPITQQQGMNHLLATIPAEASVAATDTLNPHLSDRYTLYLMPDPLAYGAEYVAVDIPDAAAEYRAADAIMYQRMRASGRYQVLGSAYDVVVLKRIGPPLDPAPTALARR